MRGPQKRQERVFKEKSSPATNFPTHGYFPPQKKLWGKNPFYSPNNRGHKTQRFFLKRHQLWPKRPKAPKKRVLKPHKNVYKGKIPKRIFHTMKKGEEFLVPVEKCPLYPKNQN